MRLTILISFLLLPFFIFAEEYQVDKTKQNLVKFISDAPIENFEGVTDKIDGYIALDESDFLKNSNLYFEVDLRTLDTGIGLRNRHMRENYLHTDKYPYTNYKGKIIYTEKVSDTEQKVTVDGTMSIHGKTKPLKINGNLFKTENGYKIKAYFEVKLTDYNIEVPKLMFMKISETMKLVLDFNITKIKK